MSGEESHKAVTELTRNANKIIKNHMIWSMGAGLIPIPIVDFFAVGAIQLDMIRQLAKLHDIDFKETEGKAFISALTGGALAQIGVRAVKFIPGVGSVLGGVTLAVLSGGSTYALGEVFKKHFESGGTFLDFDPSRLKKFYDEQFEKGKEMASKVKEEQEIKAEEAQHATSEGSVVDQLSKLADLKSSGVITDEEFEDLKKKLLET